MKKIILCSMLVLVGCSKTEAEPETKAILYSQSNTVDVSQQIKIPDFSLSYDWEYDLQEKYGSISFKAIYLCNQKYDSMLNGIDLSSDQGSSIYNDYQIKVQMCSIDSLKNEPIIPVNLRHKIPRDEPQLVHEEKVKEIENSLQPYEQLPQPDYDVNNPRYPIVKKECEEANSYYKGTKDFDSSVEFCIRKGM